MCAMKIKVYGACCASCHATFEAVREAAASIDPAISVEHVEDVMTILKYHIMQAPAVVIDGRTVSSGQRLTVNDAMKIIRENIH